MNRFGLTPHQNGSGVSGVSDLRLGKSLLQLKNQEDFSHQVSLEFASSYHTKFLWMSQNHLGPPKRIKI